ncbi:MAG: hypothetical protein ACK4GT_14010 [Pararhodobacter sp.]
MTETAARKRLFTETHRRRPWTGAPRPRLLGGQAMAAAQRLSRASMRPRLLGYLQFFADLLCVALAGRVAYMLIDSATIPVPTRIGADWFGALCVVIVARLAGAYGFRIMRSLWRAALTGLMALALGLLAVVGLLIIAGVPPLVAEVWALYWFFGAVGLMMATRVAMGLRIAHLVQTGRLEHRIVVVGGGAGVEPLVREIDRERGRGRRMCGFFDERRDERSPDVIAGHHKTASVNCLRGSSCCRWISACWTAPRSPDSRARSARTSGPSN